MFPNLTKALLAFAASIAVCLVMLWLNGRTNERPPSLTESIIALIVAILIALALRSYFFSTRLP